MSPLNGAIADLRKQVVDGLVERVRTRLDGVRGTQFDVLVADLAGTPHPDRQTQHLVAEALERLMRDGEVSRAKDATGAYVYRRVERAERAA